VRSGTSLEGRAPTSSSSCPPTASRAKSTGCSTATAVPWTTRSTSATSRWTCRLHLASRVNNGAPGGVQNIANVIGSQGNDLLVGDGNANVLRGGTGRNLIIGGAGPDQLYGGGGDNILISGFTSYDQNLTALNALFAEWTSTDSLSVRMQDIRDGGGRNGNFVLNPVAIGGRPATVFDDGAADALFDGAGLSWFFVHPPNDTINGGAGPRVLGDVVTVIP
jgi:Ca2+-binding RTX toxin-like protein